MRRDYGITLSFLSFCLRLANDSGWVYYSTDFYNWSRAGDLPGDIRRIYCLKKIGGDTLVAGTRSIYGGIDSGHLYISPNGLTWQFRSRLRGTRVGQAITALLEDNLGNFHAGHNYGGMTGYSPCRSTDRGFTWSNGTTSYNAYHYCLLQPSFDNNLYCGTWGTGGRVLKSTDNGASWFATGTMDDAGHVPTIIEAPGGVLYAGTYPKTNPAEPIGRVFKSTDGGANWIQIGYGYFNNTSGIRSLCRTSDGNLYAGTAPRNVPYAEVYVSTDGRETWSSTGSLPGATVVYKLLEVNTGDAVYLYAATGPNGDVFRAPLSQVAINDVGCTEILGPTGIIDSTSLVTPACSVYNYGNTTVNYTVRMKVGDFFTTTASVTNHAPGTKRYVQFSPTIVNWPRGTNPVTCSTELTGDINTANDKATGSVFVRILDATCLSIDEPTGTVNQGEVIQPKATVKNNGNTQQTFNVRFWIEGTKYEDVKEVTLNAGEETQVTFADWTAGPVGTLAMKCTTELTNDMDNTNDKQEGEVYVRSPSLGWRLVGNVPMEPDRKKIKSGDGMTRCGDKLYILKGNNTRSLYYYLPDSVLAVFEDSIPFGTGKKVKKGSGIISDGERYLYIFKGANTSEFYRYDTQRGESLWVTLEEVPSGGGKKLKGGTGVCYLSGYIYLLKGSNTNEFYRFNISEGHWEPLASPPRAKGFKDGSCLVAYNNQIYLLGNTYNNFYRYSPDANSWDSLKPMPLYHPQLNRKKKVKEGAAMTVLDNKIYAFKGGNTGEFWMYDPERDSWYGRDTIPRGSEGKRVKGGASLVTFGSDIWALKGNNTTSIWKYTEAVDLFAGLPKTGAMVEKQMENKAIGLRILPNPTKGLTTVYYNLPKKEQATLRIYNTLGELVYSAKSDKGLWTIKKLPVGIYLLRFEAKGYRVERKLIVVK